VFNAAQAYRLAKLSLSLLNDKPVHLSLERGCGTILHISAAAEQRFNGAGLVVPHLRDVRTTK
jgi:hypothetical protein